MKVFSAVYLEQQLFHEEQAFLDGPIRLSNLMLEIIILKKFHGFCDATCLLYMYPWKLVSLF